MKTISIGKAFSAMLWLVEKEHSVPDDKMQGAWNFYDKKTPLKPIDYTGLINALGYSYFDKSLYQGIEDKINLTNIIDGGRILTPESELICQPKELTTGEKLEEWVSHEIDNQFFRFGHSKHQSDSEEYVCSVKETPKDKTVKISPEEELVELMAQLNSPEAKTKIKKQETQRKDKEAEKSVLKIPVSVIDQLSASTHLQLIELLKSSNLQAHYLPAVVKFKGELTNPVKSTQIAKPINTAYWFLKPVPHYDVNAIHFGDAHKLYFTKHALSELGAGEHKIPPYHYFWYANVQIEAESFEEHIMPLIYRQFPIPTKASLSSVGNKYIINFGQDKNVEVKKSKGLDILRVLLRHSNVNSRNQVPVPSLLIDSILSKEEPGDIDRFTNNDDEGDNDESPVEINTIKKTSNKDIKIIISQIRRLIEKYWVSEHLDDNELTALEKAIISKVNVLSVMTKDDSFKNSIRNILDAYETCKISAQSLLDEIFPISGSGIISSSGEDEESRVVANGMWNTIKSGMKVLKTKCPHLYFHLLGSGTPEKKGGFKGALSMADNGLMYETSEANQRIVWELKDI